MKKILFTLFYVISFYHFSAQENYTVSGQVTDLKTGEPLPGAVVSIPEENKHSVTDIDGHFKLITSLSNITLTVHYVGYEAYTQKIRFKDNKSLDLKIPLHQKVFKLQEVVVSIPFGKLQKDNVVKIEARKTSYLKKKVWLSYHNSFNKFPVFVSKTAKACLSPLYAVCREIEF